MCLSQGLPKHETHNAAQSDCSFKNGASQSSSLGYTVQWEEGGVSMQDLECAMSLDADLQVEMLDSLCLRLDEIVRINDQRKVNIRGTQSCRLNLQIFSKCPILLTVVYATEKIHAVLRRQDVSHPSFGVRTTHSEVWMRERVLLSIRHNLHREAQAGGPCGAPHLHVTAAPSGRGGDGGRQVHRRLELRKQAMVRLFHQSNIHF